MCCNQFIALSACLVVLHIFEPSLRVRAHGVVSERFHSDSFQKAPDFLTQINENQHKPRKSKNKT